MKTFRITVGRMLCRHVRDMLGAEALSGDIKWHEGSGWIEREFTVTGDDSHVIRVANRIDSWSKLNNLYY